MTTTARTPARTQRSSPLKVNLAPELHEKLKAVAERLGVAPATVASMAIGEYVARQSAALGATAHAIDRMIEQIAPHMHEQLKLAAAEPPPPPKPPKKAIVLTRSRK